MATGPGDGPAPHCITQQPGSTHSHALGRLQLGVAARGYTPNPLQYAGLPVDSTDRPGSVRRLTSRNHHSCNTRAGVIGLANYLLVVINVDESPELVDKARELSAADPDAEFVLLAPATPPSPLELLFEPSCTARRLASRRCQRVRDQLIAANICLVAARLGNFLPIRAVEDALRFTEYSALVIAAPKRALLHMFRCDQCCRIARRFPQIKVLHAAGICVEPGAIAVRAAATTRSRSPQRLR